MTRHLFACSLLFLSTASLSLAQSGNSAGLSRGATNDPEVTRPSIRLSGKVVLEDGAKLPQAAAVATVCKGQKRIVAHTNTDGGFSFILGEQNAGVEAMGAGLADASVSASGGLPVGNTASVVHNMREWRACGVQAELPGFTSEIVEIIARMDGGGNIGSIQLHRVSHVQGLTISVTSAAAPDAARKAYEKGLDQVKHEKWDAAQDSFQKAVQIYPQYAVAWFELGLLHLRQRAVIDARRSFEQSLAADSQYPGPYLGLAQIAAQEQRWQDMAELSAKLIAVNPGNIPDAFFLNGIANYNLRKFAEAEKSARDGLKIDPEHRYPKLEYLLGIVLVERRDYVGAHEHMQNYLGMVKNQRDIGEAQKVLDEIVKLSGADGAKKN